MEHFYTYCAAIAGTLLVGQLALSLVGFGDHHDFDHAGIDGAGIDGADLDHEIGLDHDGEIDHGGQWFVGLLSFRAIVTSVTVFGLTGLAAPHWFESVHPQSVFLIALAAGGAVLYGVGWLMRMIYQLRSDGSVRIERTVGQTGSVYLTIPANKSGNGKVSVKVQGRTMEYQAMTAEEELSSGTPIVVVDVITPGTLEVAKAVTTPTQEDTNV